MNLAKAINDERGMATSLIETTVVIAIVAILSSVALGSAMGHLEDAKLSRAIADAEVIGVSVHSFMNDTGFAPAFQNGNAHGPQDVIFSVLETAGNDPGVATSLNWPMTATVHDRLENQLVKNQPAGTGTPYPRIGQISYARLKGWNGPYTASMPLSDPWDDKYFVNVQLLTPQGVQNENQTLTLGTGQRPAVFVISAGPNRQLETRFDQVADAFVAGGDDIVFRIQ
jgi:type II secretory pathway pseudopilin PulG